MDSSQSAALSRLFSPGVLREIAKKGRSGAFARLFAQSGVSVSTKTDRTVGAAFDAAFAALRGPTVRSEYVYRSALLHNVLLGVHSLNSACVLTEFRAGTCKADLVILNGTSTVYEIKSERDSLGRLEKQLADYRKVFASIYVIAAEHHIQNVLDRTCADIGIMKLARWNRIKIIRPAKNRADLVCPKVALDSLRAIEGREILLELGVKIPDLPNTQIRKLMEMHFSRMPPEQVHSSMVKVLKRTRSLSSLSDFIVKLPTSLQPAALSLTLLPSDRDRLVSAMSTPLWTALTWA